MTLFSSSGRGNTKKLGDTPRGPGSVPFAATSVSAAGSQLSTPAAVSRAAQAFAPEKTGPSPSSSPSMIGSSSSSAKLPPRGRSGESKACLLDQKPESVVAETLKMKGELEFTRLLRVDGRFEGDLITDNGSLVVGPKGEVVGDLKNMKEVYVEGIVRGNVFANDVKVKNSGMLFGDIQCLCLTLDPTASIKGVADTATLKERAIQEANGGESSAAGAAASTSSAKPTITSATGNPSATAINASVDESPAPPSASSDATAPSKATSEIRVAGNGDISTSMKVEAAPSPSF